MRNREIASYEMRLDRLFKKFDNLTDDPELLAHWSRYLCILVSGYLEESIRTIFRVYSRTKSSPNVANHVETSLQHFQNPKMELILTLCGSFSQQWRNSLEEISKDEIKDSINSIVNTRNRVAHGEDVGITPGILRNYYKNAKRLIDSLEKECGC